jgi:hypothetical protein
VFSTQLRRSVGVTPSSVFETEQAARGIIAPMKTVVLALCCVLFATQAFGQTAPQTQGRSKAVWTGAGLLAAGLIVMPMRDSPISASPDGSRDGRYNLPAIGLGLAATGGALIYWGVRDQQKRAHPNTTIGVTLRRTAAIQLRRSW